MKEGFLERREGVSPGFAETHGAEAERTNVDGSCGSKLAMLMQEGTCGHDDVWFVMYN